MKTAGAKSAKKNSNAGTPSVSERIVDVSAELPHSAHSRYESRKVDEIKLVVVHHSATQSGTPGAFARFHVETRGWPGIGYHFVVGKKGELWRTNALTTVSYHARGHNRESVGVCLVGDFTEAPPSAVQLAALEGLLRWLVAKLLGRRIVFHRDVVATTSCPGAQMPAWVKRIRA